MPAIGDTPTSLHSSEIVEALVGLVILGFVCVVGCCIYYKVFRDKRELTDEEAGTFVSVVEDEDQKEPIEIKVVAEYGAKVDAAASRITASEDNREGELDIAEVKLSAMFDGETKETIEVEKTNEEVITAADIGRQLSTMFASSIEDFEDEPDDGEVIVDEDEDKEDERVRYRYGPQTPERTVEIQFREVGVHPYLSAVVGFAPVLVDVKETAASTAVVEEITPAPKEAKTSKSSKTVVSATHCEVQIVEPPKANTSLKTSERRKLPKSSATLGTSLRSPLRNAQNMECQKPAKVSENTTTRRPLSLAASTSLARSKSQMKPLAKANYSPAGKENGLRRAKTSMMAWR